MTDLTQATAFELSDLYQSGAVSPVTVAEQVLAKIERVNPVLNAFCFTDPDTTMSQSRASEQRWQQGQPLSALDGVPIAVKDSMLTKGWPTLYGSRAVDPDQPWLEDAPAVARLREAGAVFAGKTTMSEFGSSTHNSNSLLYGTVYNSWNTNYSPGGSSGGCAVAVASNLVPLAVGSDFGTSVSVPSAFCGVFGFKPTFGRIPRYPTDAFNYVSVGVFSRSVNDISTAMNIISNPDVRDVTALPFLDIDWTKNLDVSLDKLKVLYCKTINSEPCDPGILEKTNMVANWLQMQGAVVHTQDINLDNFVKIQGQIIKYERCHQWQNIPVDRRLLTGKALQKNAILAQSASEIVYWINQRHYVMSEIKKLMQTYDVILSPATVVSTSEDFLNNNGSQFSELVLSPFSLLYSNSQQPSMAVPVGLNANSMPESVMIAGAVYNDVRVLQVAQAIQKQFPMPSCPVIL